MYTVEIRVFVEIHKVCYLVQNKNLLGASFWDIRDLDIFLLFVEWVPTLRFLYLLDFTASLGLFVLRRWQNLVPGGPHIALFEREGTGEMWNLSIAAHLYPEDGKGQQNPQLSWIHAGKFVCYSKDETVIFW